MHNLWLVFYKNTNKINPETNQEIREKIFNKLESEWFNDQSKYFNNAPCDYFVIGGRFSNILNPDNNNNDNNNNDNNDNNYNEFWKEKDLMELNQKTIKQIKDVIEKYWDVEILIDYVTQDINYDYNFELINTEEELENIFNNPKDYYVCLIDYHN